VDPELKKEQGEPRPGLWWVQEPSPWPSLLWGQLSVPCLFQLLKSQTLKKSESEFELGTGL
jgi:hypothetical protein